MSETIDSGVNQEVAVPLTETNMTHEAQERQVPLGALEAERAKRQQYEEENRMMRDHLTLMQAQSRVAPPPPAQDAFTGMDDADVMTVGEFKKLASSMVNQVEMSLSELRVQQKYPDYHEVITKHLPNVIKDNPKIADHLKRSQDYELAYYLATNSDSYKQTHKKAQRNEEAERIVKNYQQGSTLSSMGATAPVSGSKSYKTMSDAEFRETMARNLGY